MAIFLQCKIRHFKVVAKRTQCCGHIVADTNVSPFARARSICCGHKFCVRDTTNVSDFCQKHFVSATNVSPSARHGHKTNVWCPARLPPPPPPPPRNIISNNVSATLCPRLPPPLNQVHKGCHLIIADKIAYGLTD